jgi:hypothetical protein
VQTRNALDALRRGAIGDTAERQDLRILTEELEVMAWNLQDQVEDGHAAEAESGVAPDFDDWQSRLALFRIVRHRCKRYFRPAISDSRIEPKSGGR